MERIRQRLLDESAGIKKSEDKRKEREGKKFGKQVQVEKLKERERGKKEMEERLKGLKRSTFIEVFLHHDMTNLIIYSPQSEKMYWTIPKRGMMTLTSLLRMQSQTVLRSGVEV